MGNIISYSQCIFISVVAQVGNNVVKMAVFSGLFLSGSEFRLLGVSLWFLDGIVQAAVRRQSESSEPLTPEPPDAPPQRKRKKKKVPTGMSDSCRWKEQ